MNHALNAQRQPLYLHMANFRRLDPPSSNFISRQRESMYARVPAYVPTLAGKPTLASKEKGSSTDGALAHRKLEHN